MTKSISSETIWFLRKIYEKKSLKSTKKTAFIWFLHLCLLKPNWQTDGQHFCRKDDHCSDKSSQDLRLIS